MKTNDNGLKSLKRVMCFMLFIEASVVGLIVDGFVSCLHEANVFEWTWANRDIWMTHLGTTLFGWNWADRGFWVLLWTAIVFAVFYLVSGMHKCNSWEDVHK